MKALGFAQSLVRQSKGHYDTLHAGVVTESNNRVVQVTHLVQQGVQTFDLNPDEPVNFFVFRANHPFVQASIANEANELKKNENIKWKLKAALRAYFNGALKIKSKDTVSETTSSICSKFVVDAIRNGITQAEVFVGKLEVGPTPAKENDHGAMGFLGMINDDYDIPSNKNPSFNNTSQASTPTTTPRDHSINIPTHSLPKVLEAALYKNQNFSMMCYTGNETVYDQVKKVIKKQIDRLNASPDPKAQEKARNLNQKLQSLEKEINSNFKAASNEQPHTKDVDRAIRLYTGIKNDLKLNTGLGIREAKSHREVKDVISSHIPKLR